MNKTIATWDVLQDFGFQPDDEVWSDVRPGLSFDFGKFKLTASCVLSLKTLHEVVLFGGVLATPNTIALVEFEMPRFVESREQCAAWIVWHLEQNAADVRVFQPRLDMTWLIEGRKHKYLLPWERQRVNAEREQDEYRARPHCTAEREWLKLALKSLARYLAQVEDTEQVEVGFDGKALSIRLAGNLVVLPAEGSPWISKFSLPAGRLRLLPKRLMSTQVDVSVWRSRLNIDRWRYDGIVETSLNAKQENDS